MTTPEAVLPNNILLIPVIQHRMQKDPSEWERSGAIIVLAISFPSLNQN